MVIVVHHLNNSRSQRVLWLLEEMGIEYRIQHYQREPSGRAPQSLLDVHPTGKSPLITDEGKGGKVVAESGAIVDYLIRHYGQGKFVPKEDNIDENNFWSHFAEGSLMPPLVMIIIFNMIPKQAPFLIRPIANALCTGVMNSFILPDVKRKMELVGDATDKLQNGWFAGGDEDGNPTSADFQMLFPLEASAAGRVDKLRPSAREWVNKVHARPAYQRALEKGGPYAYGS